MIKVSGMLSAGNELAATNMLTEAGFILMDVDDGRTMFVHPDLGIALPYKVVREPYSIGKFLKAAGKP